MADGHEVICMDNLLTGNDENVSHLSSGRFHMIKYDVTHFLAVPGKLDYVFHFASPASPVDYLEFPIQTLKVGALGTLNALGLAKAKGAVLTLASTSEVYGDPLVHPQKEDYWGNVNPIGPRGVYDEAKRYGEALVMAYHRYHALKTRIPRIFNTYGPRMRLQDGRAVPTFLTQALRNRAHYGLRRREPNPELLLHLGPDRGDRPALALGLRRAGQPRQPQRDHHRGAGADDHRGDRKPERHRDQAPAGG